MCIRDSGGSLLFAWMEMTGNENPFYEYYDEVLDILREYDVTISLGDALRPGSIHDSSDAGQLSELIELGNLTTLALSLIHIYFIYLFHIYINQIA